MSSIGYDCMYPVSALFQAFISSTGVHRLGPAMALASGGPCLHTASNAISPLRVFRNIFSDTEMRWITAQQKRLVGELPQEQRLPCQLWLLILSRPDSFKSAPVSSTTKVDGCILPYQGLDKIGLTGKRSAEKRFSICRLEEYLSMDTDVLETGCNFGFLSWLVAQRVRHVDAFDIDANYIHLGSMSQQEYETSNLRYSISKFEDFKTDRQCDAIISRAVYGWVPIPFAAFVEKLDNWLKPGGILLFESHELIVHSEWKQQRAYLTDRYELLHAGYIDDADHAFYASEYQEFLVLKKK